MNRGGPVIESAGADGPCFNLVPRPGLEPAKAGAATSAFERQADEGRALFNGRQWPSCPSKMSDASFLADSRTVNQSLTGTADL